MKRHSNKKSTTPPDIELPVLGSKTPIPQKSSHGVATARNDGNIDAATAHNDGHNATGRNHATNGRAATSNISNTNDAAADGHATDRNNGASGDTVDHDATDHNHDTANSAHKSRLTSGSRNLILLGVGATLIAILTTTIGLAIYHLSGDIYLDRSRPGFLPDEAEVEEEAETEPEEYNFEKTGPISDQVIDDYLKHLSEELNAIDGYKDPFNPAALSDDRLGIPKD